MGFGRERFFFISPSSLPYTVSKSDRVPVLFNRPLIWLIGGLIGVIEGGIKGEMIFHNSLYTNKLSGREGGMGDFLHKTVR